jgi:hypothetical protein
MKQVFTFLAAVGLVVAASGQQPHPGLVTGNSDFIGLGSGPGWRTPQLIEAGPNSFYSVGAADHISVDHPLLYGVGNDYANVYFIKYDQNGDTIAANHIMGSYNVTNAFPNHGGLTIVGSAYENLETPEGDIIVPINNANAQEYIVSYDGSNKLIAFTGVWDLDISQYPSSVAMMDQRSGNIYLAGLSYQPYNLADYGLIGEEWDDYMYVLKYDRNLALMGVFTAGFKAEDGTEYGRFSYSTLSISPDANGNVLITGAYEGDRVPVFDGEALEPAMNDMGLFALKLNVNFQKEWVKQGSMNGWDYDGGTKIFKGLSMQNGDMILAGVTTTGFFRLGSDSIVFKNGSNYSNIFSMRMTPDGKILWTRPFQNMGEFYYGEKKGVESETFDREIFWDAIQWNDDVLYMAGTFLSDSFEVADRDLENKLYEGIFVVAVDLETGDEEWGYAVSSDYVSLHGFDMDAAGNVSLMGQTSGTQEFEVLGSNTVPGTNLVLHLGLDYDGNPLWYNNAYLEGLSWGCTGADLEVLHDGEVFSSLYASQAYPLNIGGSSLSADYTYTTWVVALDVDNVLGGTVKDKQLNPVYPGYVKAFKSTRSGAFPAMDSALLDEAGVYLFNGLYPGHYVLQALPDTERYPDGMPTYFNGAISWDEAQEMIVETNTNATFANITLSELPKLTPEDGTGEMFGNVSYEDEGGLKGTMSKPVTRTSVILVRRAARKSTLEGNVMAYVITDLLGDYQFENVPDGDYTLIVDIPGLDMRSSYEVTMLGNKLFGLNFEVGKEEINASGTVDVETVSMDRLMIFPNPGNGLVHIAFPSGDYLVDVFNTVGKLVHSSGYPSAAGLELLDISALHDGIYLIRINGDNANEVVKYMKK